MKSCYEEELRKLVESYGFDAVVSAAKKFWNEPQTHQSCLQQVDGKKGVSAAIYQ
jgi:hypothetical protein